MNFVCRCKSSARPRLIQTILFGRLTQVISPEGTSISCLSTLCCFFCHLLEFVFLFLLPLFRAFSAALACVLLRAALVLIFVTCFTVRLLLRRGLYCVL